MSNGSIMELVAKGKLDEDITDTTNQTSLFNYNISKKNKYSKGDYIFYTEGNPNWGNTFRINIEKKGDLLYDLYLIVKLPKLSISNLNVPIQQDEHDTTSKYLIKYVDFIGNVLIDKVSLYINGQLIDEQYGDYIQLYTDLYMSDWNRKALIGMDDIFNKPNLKIDSENIYIPLKFWFCIDDTKSLPVIALQYSEIYIDVKFKNFSDCVMVLEKGTDGNLYHSDYTHKEVLIEGASLLANFFYVDLEERKKLATQEYELLITQSQVRTINISNSANLEINFNNTVKDIFFFIQSTTYKKYGEYFNFSTKMHYLPIELKTLSTNAYKLWKLAPKKHLLNRARILFNGAERVEWRDAKYFYYMQNHENYGNSLQSYIYMYSFNSEPQKFSNNSGCNFSRIDNAYLQVEISPNKFYLDTNLSNPSSSGYELKCYATNFNIMVIKNGLCGLKYTN